MGSGTNKQDDTDMNGYTTHSQIIIAIALIIDAGLFVVGRVQV